MIVAGVGVLSFGFRFPGWILVAGLAFVWLAGLTTRPMSRGGGRD